MQQTHKLPSSEDRDVIGMCTFKISNFYKSLMVT